jgi:hypothetical protein
MCIVPSGRRCQLVVAVAVERDTSFGDRLDSECLSSMHGSSPSMGARALPSLRAARDETFPEPVTIWVGERSVVEDPHDHGKGEEREEHAQHQRTSGPTRATPLAGPSPLGGSKPWTTRRMEGNHTVTGWCDPQSFQELSPDVRKLMERRTKPEIRDADG